MENNIIAFPTDSVHILPPQVLSAVESVMQWVNSISESTWFSFCSKISEASRVKSSENASALLRSISLFPMDTAAAWSPLDMYPIFSNQLNNSLHMDELFEQL